MHCFAHPDGEIATARGTFRSINSEKGLFVKVTNWSNLALIIAHNHYVYLRNDRSLLSNTHNDHVQ